MKIPEFKDENEEAEWFSEHREELGTEFAQAMREGRTSKLPTAQLLEQLRRSRETQLLSLRIAVTDLEEARVQAARKGIGYQTYIKMLLHEALQNAAQRT